MTTFTAGIDIEFEEKTSLGQILEIMAAAGWGYALEGRICYVPHCSDGLDWEQAPAAAWPHVLVILETKHAHREKASLVLHWGETPYGCALHVFADGDITLDFGSRRKLLQNCNSFTDISWYLSRSVCPLQNAGLHVETVRFSEVSAPESEFPFEHPSTQRLSFGDDIVSPVRSGAGDFAIR